MARLNSTTVHREDDDIRALKLAPSTLLFESTDENLGDEPELFRDLED